MNTSHQYFLATLVALLALASGTHTAADTDCSIRPEHVGAARRLAGR
jgi:hypothetical protein